MARELWAVAGPELNHKPTYTLFTFGGGSSDWLSIVNTPAPAQGSYRFKATGPGGGGISAVEVYVSASRVSKSFYWYVIRQFRLVGTLNSGQELWFFHGSSQAHFNLRWVYLSANTYRIDLYQSTTQKIQGTSVLNTGTDYSIRLDCRNVSAINVAAQAELFVDGVSQGTTTNLQVNNSSLTLAAFGSGTNKLEAGQEMYWRGVAQYASDSEADRPGTALWVDDIHPEAEGTDDEYGYHGNCDLGGSGLADWSYWDDYAAGGTPDDATTVNCGRGADWEQTSHMTTVSPPGGPDGVVNRYWLRANVASKTVDNWARIRDVSNLIDQQLDNLSSTTWGARSMAFPKAPGGVDWTQAALDSLQCGHRVASGNGGNAEVSALGVEVVACDDDPPPAVGVDRRRLLAGVI